MFVYNLLGPARFIFLQAVLLPSVEIVFSSCADPESFVSGGGGPGLKFWPFLGIQFILQRGVFQSKPIPNKQSRPPWTCQRNAI